MIDDIFSNNETGHNTLDCNLVDGFECSECGVRIEDYREVELDDEYHDEKNYKEFEPKYCPNCGRRIEDA